MTDKERLEEIKLKFNNTIDTMLYIPYEDVKFLIEQAERVYELEKQIADDEHFVAEILEQNKRYRETLEFYANRENYKPDHYDPDIHEYISMVDYDDGATARKALEGKE